MITHSSPINRLTSAGRYLTKARNMAIAEGVSERWIGIRSEIEYAIHEVDMSIKELSDQGCNFNRGE